MSEEKLLEMSDKEKLKMIRAALPYQYARIIASRLTDKTITAAKVRAVFSDSINDRAITVPVLTEAWRLYEEQKKAKMIIEQTLQGGLTNSN